jgi:hypothetical protein
MYKQTAQVVMLWCMGMPSFCIVVNTANKSNTLIIAVKAGI